MNLRPEFQVMIVTIISTDAHNLAGMLSLVSQVHSVNEYLCCTAFLVCTTYTHLMQHRPAHVWEGSRTQHYFFRI